MTATIVSDLASNGSLLEILSNSLAEKVPSTSQLTVDTPVLSEEELSELENQKRAANFQPWDGCD